jgi:hypothetical protein
MSQLYPPAVCYPSFVGFALLEAGNWCLPPPPPQAHQLIRLYKDATPLGRHLSSGRTCPLDWVVVGTEEADISTSYLILSY